MSIHLYTFIPNVVPRAPPPYAAPSSPWTFDSTDSVGKTPPHALFPAASSREACTLANEMSSSLRYAVRRKDSKGEEGENRAWKGGLWK